jgi:hypothetical protein
MQSQPNTYFQIFSETNIIPGMQRHGFQIRFENGHTISAMFGTNLYCSCPEPNAAGLYPLCSDVEVAIVDPCGEFVKFKSTGDDVKGRVTPAEFVEIVSWVSKIEKENN